MLDKRIYADNVRFSEESFLEVVEKAKEIANDMFGVDITEPLLEFKREISEFQSGKPLHKTTLVPCMIEAIETETDAKITVMYDKYVIDFSDD